MVRAMALPAKNHNKIPLLLEQLMGTMGAMRFSAGAKLLLIALICLAMIRCTNAGDTATTSNDTDSDNDTATLFSDNDIIDLHGHAEITATDVAASDLVAALNENGVALSVFMPTPHATDPNSHDESASLISFFTNDAASFRYFYGGQELQPILHGLGRPSEFTLDSVYPNGATGDESEATMAEMNAIADASATWETEFQTRATTAAASGDYLGFGELAPRHYSLHEGHPDIEYPADSPQMLWLSDLAAEHGLVIDIHMELTQSNVSQLENLLAHNRDTKIILDHAGWSNSGYATAEILAALMAAHSNLYLSLKLREADSAELTATSPFETENTLKSEWLSLLSTYSARIMIGMDVKYWQSQNGAVSNPATALGQLVPSYETLLSQLPSEAAADIRRETAIRILGL